MNGQSVTRKKFKLAVGSAVLAGLVLAATVSRLGGRHRVLAREEIESAIARTPGFAGILSLKLDGAGYSGQEAAKVVAIDVLIDSGAGPEAISGAMRAAGEFIRGQLSVYRKLVVTGYRGPRDFDGGLAFRSRAIWLAPEYAAPMDGWSTLRLPDEKRPIERALEGIYARPTVSSAQDGRVVATTDLAVERLRRPAADAAEILTLPLVDSLQFDNAFDRCPDLRSLEVTLVSGGERTGRFAITREAYAAADVSTLLADLSKKVLRISSKQAEIAERYSNTQLYTPLLFDTAVSAEDKAEIKDLESRRKEAEAEFYSRLFAGGTWEPPKVETAR